MPRPTRPFTVEVRSSRKRLLNSPVLIARMTARGLPTDELPTEKPHGPALDGFSIDGLFSRRLGRPAEPPTRAPVLSASTSEAQPQAEAPSKPPTARILPDLQAEDPMEALLRRTVEERASRPRGRPPGSRNKPKPQPIEVALKPSAEETVRPKAAVRQARPPKGARAGVAKRDGPVLAVAKASRPTHAQQPVRPASLDGSATQASFRRTKRRDVTAQLPPGQRWKRLLPKALW